MRCEEALEWIQRELDGDLAPEEEVLLRRHLSTCIQCAAEADRFRRLSEGLSRLPRVTPPHSVVDRLIESGQLRAGERVCPRTESQRRRFRWWIGGGAAAAILLIGSAGLWAGWFRSDAPAPADTPSLMMNSETAEDAASPAENMTMSAPEVDSPATPVLSPDGRYRAEVESDHVVIKTADGKKQFQSEPLEKGNVASMQWLSPSSLQVEIDHPEGEGKPEVRIIDVETKREQKIDPSRGEGR